MAKDSPVRSQADGKRFDVRVEASPAACMKRLEELADVWSGEMTREGSSRGRLILPVRAGVRRGVVEGPVTARGTSSSQVRFDVEKRHDQLQYGALVFLVLGAIGGILTLLVPWIPSLFPLAPVGIIFAVGAWLFIVARLTNSGPEEFFAELASFAATNGQGEE